MAYCPICLPGCGVNNNKFYRLWIHCRRAAYCNTILAIDLVGNFQSRIYPSTEGVSFSVRTNTRVVFSFYPKPHKCFTQVPLPCTPPPHTKKAPIRNLVKANQSELNNCTEFCLDSDDSRGAGKHTHTHCHTHTHTHTHTHSLSGEVLDNSLRDL